MSLVFLSSECIYTSTILFLLVGYFTSRPALKGYVREMNSFLQVCKQLEAMGTPLVSLRQTKATSERLRMFDAPDR